MGRGREMSSISEEARGLSRLTGTDVLQLLLFRIGTLGNGVRELFAINVFKVREVLFLPTITPMPGGPAHVLGVANIRGQIMPVIDLAAVAGASAKQCKYLLVTEFQRSTQGFAVEDVEEIVRLQWSDVLSAHEHAVGGAITSIAKLPSEAGQSRLAQVLDAEKVLGEVLFPQAMEMESVRTGVRLGLSSEQVVVIADDSAVARSQIAMVLKGMEAKYVLTRTGREAWEKIRELADAAHREGRRAAERIALVLTDLEMPEMDGFTLTRMVKGDAALKMIPVIVHSSLTGRANEEHARQAGAEDYVGKFAPDELAEALRRVIRAGAGSGPSAG